MLGLSGLAGCLGARGSEEPSSTPTPPVTTGGVFERVAVEGTTLVVDLAEDTDVDTVNVIAPNGELYRRLAVYRGVTRVSVDIEETYTPGVYEIVGAKRAESIGSVQLDVVPELVVTDVSLEADGRAEFPEKLGRTAASEVAVSMTNAGSGPAFIRKLLVLGDVPNPTTNLIDESLARSGMFDAELNQFYSDGVTLPAGDSIVVFSDTLPFSFVGDGMECGEEPRRGQAEVTLQTHQAGYAVSVTMGVAYGLAGSDGTCRVRIEPGVADA
jgi:hypothetical protein